jgi:hypothetical protein
MRFIRLCGVNGLEGIEISDAAADDQPNLLLLHIAELLEAVLEEVVRQGGAFNAERWQSHLLSLRKTSKLIERKKLFREDLTKSQKRPHVACSCAPCVKRARTPQKGTSHALSTTESLPIDRPALSRFKYLVLLIWGSACVVSIYVSPQPLRGLGSDRFPLPSVCLFLCLAAVSCKKWSPHRVGVKAERQ